MSKECLSITAGFEITSNNAPWALLVCQQDFLAPALLKITSGTETISKFPKQGEVEGPEGGSIRISI